MFFGCAHNNMMTYLLHDYAIPFGPYLKKMHVWLFSVSQSSVQ